MWYVVIRDFSNGLKYDDIAKFDSKSKADKFCRDLVFEGFGYDFLVLWYLEYNHLKILEDLINDTFEGELVKDDLKESINEDN